MSFRKGENIETIEVRYSTLLDELSLSILRKMLEEQRLMDKMDLEFKVEPSTLENYLAARAAAQNTTSILFFCVD